MPANPLRIDDLTVGTENLSEEARQIVAEAAKPLQDWVEKGVNKLINDSTAAVEKAAVELRAEIADSEKLLQDTQSRLEKLQADLKTLQVTFDSPQLKAGADALAKATDEAVKELAEKRKQFRDRGRTIGNTAIAVLKTARG